MFGCIILGWLEQYVCYVVNGGVIVEDLWGGILVVVFMGDDVQFFFVCDIFVYIEYCYSVLFNYGCLVWIKFDSVVELVEIVR